MSTSLRERAAEILQENDRGRHTIPSGRLYPHQWAWDSAFAAIGWAHLDLERACQELESILEGQWEDGRVPHIRFSELEKDYFPGPESWGCEKTSTISNPPVWTLAAERLLELGAAPERVESWLPKIEWSLRFLKENRDPLGWNCIATCHPWENGQDNNPAWDAAMEAVDPESAPEFKRVDVEKVGDASQRPTDIQYKRYMALVHEFTQNGFQMGSFAVYDPFFTTMTVLCEQAMARLSRRFGFESDATKRAQQLRGGLVEKLWSEELGRYRYYDIRGKKYLSTYTSSSLIPVLLGEDTPGYDAMLRALQTEFMTECGLPTVAPSSPDFDPVCYWRGPSWVNMNWFFSTVLGEPLVQKTLAMVEKSGFWEYFHPETGKGLGAGRFTWTAALVLDMLSKEEEQ